MKIYCRMVRFLKHNIIMLVTKQSYVKYFFTSIFNDISEIKGNLTMGRSFIKKFFLGIFLSFIASYSYAIEVIPPQAPTSTLPPLQKEAIEPEHDEHLYQNTIPSKPLTPVVNNTPQNPNERIYYVRSMTSNNPEYKTRFSILHETPSPKRIAGERLYNLSDENFRISVVGNQIKVLDNPRFKLTGINSAKGRTGELALKDGGILNVESVSNRFRGNWDMDGTGDVSEKVTPTNLISGTLPATLITRNIDGSIRTHEDYLITFKAMAMGPYNGYWSNGDRMSIWLWGMSRTKTKSGEFTYVGLDLGITTVGLPQEATGTIIEDPTPVVAPIAPAPIIGNNTYIPEPATGGIQTGPYGGGFGGGMMGYGGGFYGGGGETIIIEKPYCVENPNDAYCTKLNCLKTPNDSRCIINCDKNPTHQNCQIDCIRNPNDSRCVVDCRKNPTHPTCVLDCTKTPNDSRCFVDCKRNPKHPSCVLDCTKTPNDSRCVVDCKKYPTHPVCVCDCKKTPNDPRCTPKCEDNPNDPRCVPNCEKNPTHPSCGVDCKKTPNDPRCKVDCNANPTDPSCVVDCSTNPSDPRCTPSCPDANNPLCGTEVSEPWWISLTLLLGLGYILKRRRDK